MTPSITIAQRMNGGVSGGCAFAGRSSTEASAKRELPDVYTECDGRRRSVRAWSVRALFRPPVSGWRETLILTLTRGGAEAEAGQMTEKEAYHILLV